MAEQGNMRAPLVSVMGASGVGKSAVGRALAQRIGVAYADGDDFHSAANIAKMRSGTPLDDQDRAPWLDAIARWLAEQRERGAVVSCSALRRSYRDRLRAQAPTLTFLHLCASAELLRARTAARADHFMPPSLVASQLATLEPLEADERGVSLDAARPIAELITEFLARV